ncbi:MAG: hypothetical protein AAF902_09600 [Chloroflexota bacterium]
MKHYLKLSHFKNFLVFCVLFSLLGCTVNGDLGDNPYQTEPIQSDQGSASESTSQNNQVDSFPISSAQVWFSSYQGVLIPNKGKVEQVEIVASVVRLNPSVKCPYAVENCPIEPYPNEWGQIQIIEASPFVTNQPIQEEAGSAGSAPTGSESSVGSNQGIDIGGAKEEKSNQLEVDRTYETLFLLTTQPVKVNYSEVLYIEPVASQGDSQSGANSVSVDTSTANTGIERQFLPVPKQGGQYVFSLPNSPQYQESSIDLPGVSVGTKLRATVEYDNGIIYMKEYTVLEE